MEYFCVGFGRGCSRGGASTAIQETSFRCCWDRWQQVISYIRAQPNLSQRQGSDISPHGECVSFSIQDTHHQFGELEGYMSRVNGYCAKKVLKDPWLRMGGWALKDESKMIPCRDIPTRCFLIQFPPVASLCPPGTAYLALPPV